MAVTGLFHLFILVRLYYFKYLGLESKDPLFSLLDAVMMEPVLIQHDDDVHVFNRPAAEEYYHTRPPPSIDDEM